MEDAVDATEVSGYYHRGSQYCREKNIACSRLIFLRKLNNSNESFMLF